MHFFFRVDANDKIGSGHLSRCASLANFLFQKRFKITFITNTITKKNLDDYISNSFSLIRINPKNLIDDAYKTNKILLKKKKSFLIADGYNFGVNWQKKINNKIKLILLNDYNNKKLKKILNINPSQNKNFINLNSFGIPIVNDKYNFKNYIKRFEKIKKNYSILISFGSSDRENFTEKLSSIINFNKFKKFNFIILIGKYYKHEKILKKKLQSFKNIKFIKGRIKLYSILNNLKMGIVTSSLISRELMYLGIPSVVIKVSDNQKFNHNYFRKNEIFDVLNANQISFNKKNKINNLITKNLNLDLKKYLKIISHIQTDYFNRIYYLLTKSSVKKINIRKIKAEDFNFLFNLINQKKNRSNSFKKKKIEILEHHKWFQKRVIQNGQGIYILIDIIGTRLGQFRFDYINKKYFIDYSIDENFYKMGLGKKIICFAIDIFKKKYKSNLYAKVLHKNLPSNKIFKNYPNKINKKYNLYKLV